MQAKVTWQKELQFIGVADSGFPVKMDSHSGPETGVSPVEMVAIALAGCTAMDVISILKKKQQIVTAFEVKVQVDQAPEFPKVFTHTVITYHVTGHSVDETALRRSIELSATKYCPAQAMLAKVVPMELCYQIYEGESAENRSLVKTGTYTPVIA